MRRTATTCSSWCWRSWSQPLCREKRRGRAYLAEEAQKEAAALEKRLGGAQLESHPLFEKVSREEGEKLLGKLKETWETLEEMEDGDAAKSLVFFLSRNASVLCVLLGDAWLRSTLGVLRESCEAAVSGRGEGE